MYTPRSCTSRPLSAPGVEDGVDGGEVARGKCDADEHSGKADLDEGDEGDGEALHLRLGRHDNVGGGADEGAVAAKARAKGEGPGEGLDGDAGDLLDHLLHDGDHGGREGDVVDKRREDGRGPHDKDDGEDLAGPLVGGSDHRGEGVCDEAEEAELADALDDDKESREEEESVPLDAQKGLVAVVHVEGDEEPDGAHDGDPGGVEVRDGVQEEGGDDAPEHDAALDEESAVGDGVHLLELDNVDRELALDGVAVVPGEVLEDKGGGQEHAGGEVEEE
mmetsp:Transcript_8160/g.19005  ORF Transcript_8160/g.19005 Transcript_8160/m.19005 type:complete len:277 (-) Transcript_8160:1815-2645(-)